MDSEFLDSYFSRNEVNMTQYDITGMNCAACSARVEKAVSSVEGVTSCSVNLLLNSMGVEGTAGPEQIIRAVEKAGYGARLKSAPARKSEAADKPEAADKSEDVRKSIPAHKPALPQNKGIDNAGTDYHSGETAIDSMQNREIESIRRRLIASLIPMVPLLYISMGHMMWNWPLPGFLNNHAAMGWAELVLTAIIMVINRKFFVNGVRGVLHGAPNMDTLVALGASAAFGYSVYALAAMEDALYFESAAMILTLITVGKLLEAKSKGRTTDALKSLMKLSPETAVILQNGEEREVPIERVQVGDRFVVKPGEHIPVDGVVLEGNSAVNEAALTGESIPVDKAPGDIVSAATTNQSGHLVCEATKVGADTTLSKIIQMVSDAAATKAPIAKIADRVSGIFVPAVILIALVTFVIWKLTGESTGFALARAISVLVISCPCALGLATPVAIMVGNGVAARNGILFKTAVSLEETGKAKIIALDKTGTITKGEPKVVKLLPRQGITEDNLLQMAFMLEAKSEHPLAKAIVAEVTDRAEKAHRQKEAIVEELTDFRIEPGNGLQGSLNGKQLAGGNAEFITRFCELSNRAKEEADELASRGMTPLFFARDGQFLGIIAVADVIKEDSARAIRELKEMGLHVVMLTGDHEKTAAAIGRETGVDEVIAGVRPDGKEDVVKHLQEKGKVVMVGDGINDAPALTRADIGIAIGAGTDVAIDAADVVLMKSSLLDVAAAIRLSRATLRNIHQNLFWAFFYNVIGIPLAAGLWIRPFGLTLNPMFGAAAMSLSSFCVVTNALRLNLAKIENKKEHKSMENNLMEITVMGMMCGHCEAHVKKALEKIEGVVEATADHNTNKVVIRTTAPVAEDAIKAAVEDAGYEFVKGT